MNNTQDSLNNNAQAQSEAQAPAQPVQPVETQAPAQPAQQPEAQVPAQPVEAQTPVQTVQQPEVQAPTQQATIADINQQMQNIPNVDQNVQDFVANTQAANEVKQDTEKKGNLNILVIIIIFAIIFAALFFVFPRLV